MFSRFGTSGNEILDQFISKNKLKWIPYNKLKNIKHLDEGGFSTIYKAKYNGIEIVLKYFNYFNNSDKNLNEFLNEWEIIYYPYEVINIFGFTKNPNTLSYMLIMEYMNKGNLRGCLTEIANNWEQKLYILYKIIRGINNIHKEDHIHYNFHDGSYQSIKSILKKDEICGVLPFIAPEVLRGKPYTQTSDIYSFSMIMWEFTSGIPPFNNRSHDFQLALSICKGERPEIIEEIPQYYIDLMKKCWDDNPLKRPTSSEILDIIEKWVILSDKMKIEGIDKELKRDIMEFINAPIENKNFVTESHPQAYYTSRLLNFTEMTAETYFQNSQNELKENRTELIELQQNKFQFEQDIQKLKLDLAIQIKEFAEKENTLQTKITYLQDEIYEKQALANDLSKQLEQNKLNNKQVQIQLSQLEQEKTNLQEKLTQQIEQAKIDLHDMMIGIRQEQRLTTKNEAKLVKLQAKLIKLQKEIDQLEQKLNKEEEIKNELAQALQVKEDKIEELEQKLINLDNVRINKLSDKREELDEIEKKLLNKLSSGGNTKELHQEKKAKEKEIIEIKKDQLDTSASYDNNRKKTVNCKITINNLKAIMACLKARHNSDLPNFNKEYNSLMNIVQKNKELQVILMISSILRLNSINLDKYNIFKIVTNSQEGTRAQLNLSMMAEDINSLRKNLDELKSELKQEKEKLKNLAAH
ncbi:hypothetical protein RclHR1_06780001 [Rhizophagus clarus]|uniref:Protein kinase domain-containing protein n=2 Tax=Rhizophagus clarus TaxID=94130 RepID=A0A2Z6SJG5_9GLOM|nr:hypothetical protein RclHR1_06780001 [Rhizophagus clarus]